MNKQQHYSRDSEGVRNRNTEITEIICDIDGILLAILRRKEVLF